MSTVAIVVIAYNREKSLGRLLHSLNLAMYPVDVDVPLIISVDKSENELVRKTADDFVWEHGTKNVKLHENNLGLKEHVLLCGNYTEQYDGIIVLEDDLYVAPAFYMYALAALKHVDDDDRIGGVSLYNHRLNVHVREPFEALDDGYDNYYFSFASSWGQAYTREQWAAFREWYEAHKDEDIASGNVPVNVSSWSEKSWLKYYIKYLIDTNKYFLYPRISYTTNFGDEGTHAAKSDNDLQVPLSGKRRAEREDFNFSTLDESGAVYDAYFENLRLKNYLSEYKAEDISIDLYGYKQDGALTRYILSSRSLQFKIIQSYGRRLRPIDANIAMKLEGNDFFLYDREKGGMAPKEMTINKYLYNYRAIKAKEMIKILFYRLRNK